jgi:hypothetical protein
MQPTLIRAFAHELEKNAVNFETLQSYLAQRAAQGVGGAAALEKSLIGSSARTSREALQSMDGLQKFRLNSVLEGGKAQRAMQRLPQEVGLGSTTQSVRQRVGDAIKAETAGAPTRAQGVPLSKHYEGYMTRKQLSYSPEHVEQVMGLEPGTHAPKPGPTKLMKPTEEPISSSGSRSIEKTMPSRPVIPPHMVPTVRPPARRPSFG